MTDTCCPIRIGCAGWTIAQELADRFGPGDSHLARYATRFTAVEINTSFNKPHRPKTYETWAASAPDDFRFAVKLPKQVTHASRLADLAALGYFLNDVVALGDKLGPLLIQLPPSTAFDLPVVQTFCSVLRERFSGSAVLEPRHSSWFAPEVDHLLAGFHVARVVADPAPVPAGKQPGGWAGLVYYRLHGAPQTYYSSYGAADLDRQAASLVQASASAPVWCIFDNTAAGAATANALDLLSRVNK